MVSIHTDGVFHAKDIIAPAVYDPIPGSVWSVSVLRGIFFHIHAQSFSAARLRNSARLLYPRPDQRDSTSALEDSASFTIVGNLFKMPDI